jgi:hypothetical protein
MSAIIQSLQTRQVCGFTAAASWLIMVWEAMITMDEEVKFIWPMSRTAYIKWFYFFGKYFALALQTAVFGIQVGYLENHVIPLHWCRIYRLLEMAATTLLMLCFDAVLLVRIYALYGCQTWASVFATCGVIIEFVTTIASAVSTIPMTWYDSSCAMIEVPKTILVFVVGTFVAQAILLWFAYRRREHAVRVRSSIACITIRDGFLVFVCIAVFLLIIFISTLYGSLITTLAIFWIPVVTSVATTRLILNLRSRSNEVTQQFTTEIWGLHGSADSFLLSDAPFQRRAA